MPSSYIQSNWVPPKLNELHARSFGKEILVINPRVPAWIVTNSNGLALLQCANGKSSLSDIHVVIKRQRPNTREQEIINFFNSAHKHHMFGEECRKPDHFINDKIWKGRKLGAVYLHLTNKCNLQCSYCYRESSPFVPIRSSTENICHALQKLKNFVVRDCELTFSGGEPLVHPGFLEIAKHSVELGYENRLLTNGILVDERKADFICKYFKSGKISLDSPEEKENSQSRGGNFKRVVRAIHLLSERGFDLEVQVTVGQSNLKSSIQIENILPKNQKVKFTPVLPMGRGAEHSEEFISNNDFQNIDEEVSGNSFSGTPLPANPTRGCFAGSGSISVADNGDIYPCHLFHYEEYKMGNVYSDDLGKVLFSDPLRGYVYDMDVENNNNDCKTCGVRFVCGGGCKANTLHATGSMFGSDSHCSYLRSSITMDLFAQATSGK